MAEQETKQETPAKTVGLNIRLAPVKNSGQPVFSNFTRINGARSSGVIQEASLSRRAGIPLSSPDPARRVEEALH